MPLPSHSGRDDLMASLDRADQDLAAGRARLLDDGLIASLPEDSRIVIARCWVVSQDNGRPRSPMVMWDSASADWYREQGWTVEEFVPSTTAQGAVALDDLREIARAMYEGMTIGSPEQLAVSEFLGRAESLRGRYQDPEIEAPIKFVPGVKAHGRGR